MTGFMLTKSYADSTPTADAAAGWAQLHEWLLREQAYRNAHPGDLNGVTLAEMVPARDAGDVCGVCGQAVTWVDHLPPEQADGVVRCLVNVVSLTTDVVIDDIFPRV